MRIQLTDDDKKQFAQYMVEFELANERAPVSGMIRYANSKFPEEKRLGKAILALHHLKWMKPYFDEAKKLAKTAGLTRIDARHKHQTHADKPIEKEGKKKKNKVFLNKNERRNFAESIYLIKQENPGWRWDMIFREANKTMPPFKQLGVYSTPNAVSWLPDLLDEIDKEMRAPKPEPIVEKAPEPPKRTFEDKFVDALIGLLVPIVMDTVKSPQMAEALRKALNGEPIKKPEEIVVPKKRVLIVGLLDHVSHRIKDEWGSAFDLRCFDNNVTIDQVKDNLPAADYAILMTRFVSHKLQNAMRGHPGFLYCDGSQARVKEMLNEISLKEAVH